MSSISLTQSIVFPKDLPAAEREKYRRIPLAGAGNFRDLGGYAAADGRTVRWGRLYRSDALTRLTRRDQACLEQLGLACIVDFRSDFERTTQLDWLPADDSVRRLGLPILDVGGADARQKVTAGQVDGMDPVQMLTDAYEQLVLTFTPQYAQFVHALLAANGRPVVFHCNAGKDRAGFAAALILRLLGVPETTVLQDYLLSGPLSLHAYRWRMLLVRLIRGQRTLAVMQGLLDTRPEYLQAAFKAATTAYGSFDAYARDGLALTDADRQQLKETLLDPNC